MLKLMKYEFRKQLFTKLALLVILLLLECYFFYGVIIKSEETTFKGEMFLTIFAFAAILLVSFECVFTFYNDLKTKQSYMLFLVPRSTYSVVGAKMLSAMLQIVLSGLLIGAVAFLDAFIMAARFGELQQLLNGLQTVLRELFQLDVNVSRIAVKLMVIVLSWVMFVIVAMLSITFGATLMANSKLRGVVSFIIFIALDVAATKGKGLVLESLHGYTEDIVGILLSLLISAAAYMATAWMLQKKVCV